MGRARGCDPLRPGAGLGGLAEVAVVQAADFWELHDLARRGELDWPEAGCVLVEREVRARLMVISDVASQDSAPVSFAQDENVVEAIAPDRTDQAPRERILPRAVRRRENFLDPHALHAVAKLLAIHLVTIAQEIGVPGRDGCPTRRACRRYSVMGGHDCRGSVRPLPTELCNPRGVGDHDDHGVAPAAGKRQRNR